MQPSQSPIRGSADAPDSAAYAAFPTAGVLAEEQLQGEVIWAEELIDAEWIPAAKPAWPVRIWNAVKGAIHTAFGLVSLLVLLAVLASLPVLNLLSLGYLLSAGGTVARTGRLRDGFPGLRKGAHLGGLALGTAVCLVPLWLAASMRDSARLIDADSLITRRWETALSVLTVLIVGHILWAWCRGGKLRHFFWPAPVRLGRWLFTSGKYLRARDALWEFVVGLRVPHYFWLGLRGFVGAVIWLAVPVAVLIFASRLKPGGAGLFSLIGGLMLALVLLYLPFLQIHFAAENRFRAMFELGTIRHQFRRAQVAFWTALFITLLFALPLYVLKIELTPLEVTWLPSLVFVAFIWPARILTGWAVGRARRREQPRFFLFRWLAWLGELPVVGIYVFIAYFTQFVSWYGTYSLLEQHAFLVPAPFLGL